MQNARGCPVSRSVRPCILLSNLSAQTMSRWETEAILCLSIVFKTKLSEFKATYLPSILETHPWETRSCLEISHGLTPCLDKSTIWFRTKSGNGLPLTKWPPNWLTPGPPWPVSSEVIWLRLEGKDLFVSLSHLQSRMKMVWEKKEKKIWEQYMSSSPLQNKWQLVVADDDGDHLRWLNCGADNCCCVVDCALQQRQRQPPPAGTDLASLIVQSSNPSS